MDIAQQLWERAYFPFFETLVKRRGIARIYRESLNSQWLDAETLNDMQLNAFNALLRHAKSHVPCYRDNADLPGSIDSLSQLSQFPIMGKPELRALGTTTLSDAPGQLQWWKSTGGSTGEPFRFAHTPDSHDWRTAMSLRGYSWAGAPPGSKQAYLWGLPTQTPSRLQQLKQRLHQRVERKKIFNCFAFNQQTMRECYESLTQWQPDVLVGYTNPSYELARFIEASGLPPLRIKSMLCAAEKVHPTQRQKIAEAFQCEVFDTYGSREFMLIASECPEHNGLHVSMENLIVEVVDQAGNACAPGETGRLVITDLHNYAMPFIRYEIGDLARVSDRSCGCGRKLQLLDEIVGRSLDVIRTPDGKIIPGELFPHVMKDFPAIQRFQVVQETLEDTRLLLQADNPISSEVIEAIRSKLAELADGEFAVTIKQVDAIALTPSGKHRVTVSKLRA